MDAEVEKAKWFLSVDDPYKYFTYIDSPIPLVNNGEKLEIGWYFSDETWTELIGPYPNFEECFENFSEYCRRL